MAESGELSVGLLILAGTVGMLLLVLFIVLYMVLYQRKIGKQREVHQRDLLEAAIETQEDERSRIAADLHDDIQQQFSAVKITMKRAARTLDSGSKASGLLEEAAAMADEAIAGTRRISHDLLSPTLKKLGLAEALDTLCRKLDNTNMNAGFMLNGEYHRLDTRTELALYRVVQELVNNTMKHSEATRINMVMNCMPALSPDMDDRIVLIISDNGKGFDAEEKGHKGLGMRNIESRLSMINAEYHFESQPGKGTDMTIVIETKSN